MRQYYRTFEGRSINIVNAIIVRAERIISIHFDCIVRKGQITSRAKSGTTEENHGIVAPNVLKVCLYTLTSRFLNQTDNVFVLLF